MSEPARNKILIVDDEEMNRELLRNIFEDNYEILMAKDGKEAIEKIKRYQNEIVIILLDLVMPVMNGYQVLQLLNANNMVSKIPVVLISANTDLRITIGCYSLGAIDVISKPFIPEIVRKRIGNVIQIYQKGEVLESQLFMTQEQINEKNKRLDEFYDQFLESIGNIVEFRNLETGNHIKRVKTLTRIMATTYNTLYPDENLSTYDIDMITRFSVLHDVGKIAIPDSILLKPGRLTDSEWEIMKSHTTKGCDILDEMKTVQHSDSYKIAYDIVRYHHERYDGSGYPDGLIGDEIPLSAQLISIVDVYDSLINDSVYRKAFSMSKAFEMITGGECGVFPPKILKCFIQARKVIEYFYENQ